MAASGPPPIFSDENLHYKFYRVYKIINYRSSLLCSEEHEEFFFDQKSLEGRVRFLANASSVFEGLESRSRDPTKSNFNFLHIIIRLRRIRQRREITEHHTRMCVHPSSIPEFQNIDSSFWKVVFFFFWFQAISRRASFF